MNKKIKKIIKKGIKNKKGQKECCFEEYLNFKEKDERYSKEMLTYTETLKDDIKFLKKILKYL